MFTDEELKKFAEANTKSVKYKNGTIWESNGYGKFEIIGNYPKKRLLCL